MLETSTLTEREVAEYCRRKGIYVNQINSWKEQCLKANKSKLEDPEKLKKDLKEEKDRIKELEKELRPKQKNLAETAALSVLRKKANAIWGMKYRPEYPVKGFPSLEETREWVEQFVSWYNYVHLHSRINFITRYQRHYGLDVEIMEIRIEIYKEAKAKHPERWFKNIRDWSLPEYVSLRRD